jgi:hypothetical protein
MTWIITKLEKKQIIQSYFSFHITLHTQKYILQSVFSKIIILSG